MFYKMIEQIRDSRYVSPVCTIIKLIGYTIRQDCVIHNGQKTQPFWNGTIQYKQQPLRLKIHNIGCDQIVREV